MAAADLDALVVGAGVIGLSTALELARGGARVRVVTRESPLDTTSSIAAAIWYPYEARPERRVVPWALRSLEAFRALADEGCPAVRVLSGMDWSYEELEPPEWTRRLEGLRPLAGDELPDGYASGWAAPLPVIEMSLYLPYLLERLHEHGVVPELRAVASLEELEGAADVVLDCAGLGSRALFGDTALFPIQGQVVRTEQPGVDRWLVYARGPDHARDMGYVVPRSRDVVVGGTAVPHADGREPDAAVTERLLERAREHEPRLAGAAVRRAVVGLRPGRDEVRLELDRLPGGTAVVHCTGHGGAGVTLSVGCAEEAARLARSL